MGRRTSDALQADHLLSIPMELTTLYERLDLQLSNLGKGSGEGEELLLALRAGGLEEGHEQGRPGDVSAQERTGWIQERERRHGSEGERMRIYEGLSSSLRKMEN